MTKSLSLLCHRLWFSGSGHACAAVQGERGKKVQELLFDELWRETKRQMRSIEVGTKGVHWLQAGCGVFVDQVPAQRQVNLHQQRYQGYSKKQSFSPDVRRRSKVKSELMLGYGWLVQVSSIQSRRKPFAARCWVGVGRMPWDVHLVRPTLCPPAVPACGSLSPRSPPGVGNDAQEVSRGSSAAHFHDARSGRLAACLLPERSPSVINVFFCLVSWAKCRRSCFFFFQNMRHITNRSGRPAYDTTDPDDSYQ